MEQRHEPVDDADERALHLYISQFFLGLRSREIANITSIVDKLQMLTSQPSALAWATYFSGILADEKSRDWAKAERIYRRLLEHSLDGILRAHILLSLGITYHKHARWRDSVSYCIESAALWESLGYPIKQAVVLRQLAISYHSGFTGGDFDIDVLALALNCCHQALELLATCTPTTPDPPLYPSDIQFYQAAVWNTLGAIYGCIGNWREATDCFEQFGAICEQRQDRFHGGFALISLADACQQREPEYWPEAHGLYAQALERFREFQDPYNEFFIWAHHGMLYQKERDFANALACYEQSLAMVEQVRGGISSEEARSGFFATVVNIYANAFLVQRELGDVEAAFFSTERARSRAFLDSLVSGTTDFSAHIEANHVEATPLTVAAVQARLSSNALMLAYFTTGSSAAHGNTMAAQSVLFPKSKTFLFAITRTSVSLFDLEIDPNDLVPQVQTQWVEANYLSTSIRTVLYSKLVHACADLLQDKEQVFLIPHGPLHSIPLHALLAPDGESWLRAEGPTFVYAPSASVLLRSRPQLAQLEMPKLDAGLVVGYNGQGPSQLRFAEAEARCIAELLRCKSLIGANSPADALFQQATGLRILHFACHGEFDADSPLLSKLLVGPESVLTGQSILEGLRLKCDLVVLSACESALSQVRRGDELYGLVRAFLHSGTRALVASLWRVNDSSTILLMEEFYRIFLSGMTVAKSLRDAQIYIKTLKRHQAVERLQHLLGEGTAAKLELQPGGDHECIFAEPHHWAAFILIGDPDQMLVPYQS